MLNKQEDVDGSESNLFSPHAHNHCRLIESLELFCYSSPLRKALRVPDLKRGFTSLILFTIRCINTVPNAMWSPHSTSEHGTASGTQSCAEPQTLEQTTDARWNRTSLMRMDTSREPPSLENIPPELRLRILSSIPDVRTLRSLVCASRTYHE